MNRPSKFKRDDHLVSGKFFILIIVIDTSQDPNTEVSIVKSPHVPNSKPMYQIANPVTEWGQWEAACTLECRKGLPRGWLAHYDVPNSVVEVNARATPEGRFSYKGTTEGDHDNGATLHGSATNASDVSKGTN